MEINSANPEIYDSMQFSELIRSGNDQSLLKSDWSNCKLFREMRSKSSYTYDEKIAVTVVSIISEFIAEAKASLQNLQIKNG